MTQADGSWDESGACGGIVMAKNVGTIDKVIRVVVGLGLLSIVFVGPATPWGWLGVIPLATALIGNCPLYQLVGIGTKV